MSRQGSWGSSCTGHAATGPMVTAATVDASAVRSARPYCLIPAVSQARCLQAAVQATTPQFLRFALGSVRVAASPLLHRGGRVERGALLESLRALPRREGGWGRLREALRTQALGVRVVRVLPALLRGRPGEEEELVQVPVALPAGRTVECQPLFHHASRLCGLDAALQPQAAKALGRALGRDEGLLVEDPQGFQRKVQHLVGELFRKGRRPVQRVADPGFWGP